MNNPAQFFNPFINFQERQIDYDKLINKINRLEKNIRIIENRLNKLENVDNKTNNLEEETDMYMI